VSRGPLHVFSRSVIIALSAALVGFSQLGAVYDGDEGLHLVAARLVQAGRRPFADFFYWHEPPFLYLAAGWMTLAGGGWRAVHLLSALLTAVSMACLASLVARSLGASERRAWPASLAAVLFALNVLVLKWGTMAHNYAAALVFIVLSVDAALRTIERPGRLTAFACAFCAGSATAFTLLTAPLAPVLLVWIAARNATGTLRTKLLAFTAGALVPFLPLALIAWQAPSQTLFGLVTHHLSYRVETAGTLDYQWDVLVSGLLSPQVWVLLALSLCAIFQTRESAAARERHLVSLCGWLAATLGVFVIGVHPPVHAVYLVVLAPCLAMLATAGTSGLVRRLATRGGERFVIGGVTALFAAGLVVSAYRGRVWVSEWDRIERLAAEVVAVTPESASFYTTFPFVYVAANRLPPPGLENGWASQMTVPDDTFAMLELSSAAAIAARVGRGEFDTVLLWRDDPRFPAADLDRLYAQQKDVDRYFVLRWGLRR